MSGSAKVEGSPSEELKLLERFFFFFFNVSGAEVCLNAQCFHSFTCLRIKSECVKGEGFLISYFFLLGGGEKVQTGDLTDVVRADMMLDGVREEDAEDRAQTEADDWLWLNPRGAAQKRGGRRTFLTSLHWDTCEAANHSSRKRLLPVSTSVLGDDSDCERAITEPLPLQLPVTWTRTWRKR